MYLYLWLNILIIIFPFILSFDRKVGFWRKWVPFLGSFLTVGTAFIIWDVYATAEGHWSFNEEYLVGLRLFGLPVEEIMFFFTVPYACLFTFDAISYYMKDRKVPYSPWPFLLTGAASFVLGAVYWPQGYTSIVLLQMGVLLAVVPLIGKQVVSSRVYWIYILITTGLFVIFNMVLTAVPVVRYGSDHIWGGDGLWNGRFFSIPLEDFFYNLSMLTWYLLVYLLILRFKSRKKQGVTGTRKRCRA